MANVRRSARLSRTGAARRSSTGTRNKPNKKPRLDSLVERDETPEIAPASIASLLATPGDKTKVTNHLAQLERLKTPQTEPRLARGEMHPKRVHQSTAKAPDSGLKLGFADIPTSTDISITPSKSSFPLGNQSGSRQSMASTMPRDHRFDFTSKPELSLQAQELMLSIKADAEKIKARLMATKAREGIKDAVPAGSSRKIATAKGKASRFSDVHMEQFKKMDSIANHPSAFRARPGFMAAQAQSLKRKSSKVELDENERPHTAGKRATPRRVAPSSSVKFSPQKSRPEQGNDDNGVNSIKRLRHTDNETTSSGRGTGEIKRPTSTLYSPTKASLARAETTDPSPAKHVALHRSSSVKDLKPATTIRSIPRPSTSHASGLETNVSNGSPSKLPVSQSFHFKPLPALPLASKASLSHSQSTGVLTSPSKAGIASKLPTFSNLKSILRSSRKDLKTAAQTKFQPRPQIISQTWNSPKKVDFTPSVKSRYAVKLAADSPSPAKGRRDTPYKAVGPLGVSYDSSAYILDGDDTEATSCSVEDVTYPVLPTEPMSSGSSPAPVIPTFSAKAKEHCRRESKEFKSIFTDLHASKELSWPTLTSINTTMNKTNPNKHTAQLLSQSQVIAPTTIRQVRESGAGELVQPFRKEIATVPHGIPGKKRRHETTVHDDENEQNRDVQAKRRSSALPSVPGAWTDTILEDQENQENQDITDKESEKRARKRMRLSSVTIPEKPAARKQSIARETAARNAKSRKGKGILSFSRLNILSRPKSRV